MLVLTRRTHESIMIGDEIEMVLVNFKKGGAVFKIIDRPTELSVLRDCALQEEFELFNASIILLGVKGNQTRIGINAPKNVSVHRKEIWEKIELEKNTSSSNWELVGEVTK